MSDLTPGRPDLAIAALYAPETPARCRVSVDLSVLSTNRVVVSWADCDQVPFIGDLVDAVDLIGQREANAEVVGIDEDERTISVAIDWTTVREVPA
jgi:hypothetical protein